MENLSEQLRVRIPVGLLASLKQEATDKGETLSDVCRRRLEADEKDKQSDGKAVYQRPYSATYTETPP